MNIALFGGTFNPIHGGHLALAKGAAKELGLDTVILIPTFIPPHKESGFLAPAEHRLAMCKLAAREDPLLRVSDIELKRGGKSYTLETVLDIRREHRPEKLYFLCGADMLLSIKSWYGYKELIRQVIFCAAPRDGVDVDALREMADELHEDGGQAVALDLPPVELSSTKIRLLFENHLSAAGMLPASVEEYIYARGLYGANHAGNGQ